MNKLKPINHDLPGILWCGPAALSAVTGRPTSEIHAAIKAVRYSERAVRGVHPRTLEKAAALLGVQLERILDYTFPLPGSFYRSTPPTVAKFLRDHRAVVRNEVIILGLTSHYITVSGNSFVDNQVKTPILLRDAPGRRCRVEQVWKVVNLATV